MFRCISALTLCICSLICSAQLKKAPQLTNDSITISGRYTSYTHRAGDVFTVFAGDWTNSREKKYTTPIDPSGKFSIRLPFPAAGNLHLGWEQISQVNAGIPGETIRLYADMEKHKNKNPAAIRFEGTNAGFHTNIMQYKETFDGFAGEVYNPLIQTVTSDLVFRDSVVAILQRSLRSLAAYAQQHRFTGRAIRYLEADMRYDAAAAMSQHTYKLRGKARHCYIQTLDSITTLAQSSGFFTTSYTLMLRDMERYAQAVTKNSGAKSADSIFNLFTSTEREITCAWALNKRMDSSLTLNDEAFQILENNIKNPFLRAQLLAKNNVLVQFRQNEQLLKSTRLITSLPEPASAEEMMAQIAGQFKGNVVYIDIWGTWCLPCKEQLRHAPALKQRLKGKNVVFVYLANRTPDQAWRNAIKQYNLTGDNVVHYNLPAAQQSVFEKKYLYGGFPTYILIDKEGKFITNQAPRPSEPDEVEKAVASLL